MPRLRSYQARKLTVRGFHNCRCVAHSLPAFNAVFGKHTDFAAVQPISNTGQPVANRDTVGYPLSFFVRLLKTVL